MVWRMVRWVLGLYLLFAVVGRFVEGMGAVRCGCAADCWCQRPVLSTFRWVFLGDITREARSDPNPAAPTAGL
jgi:hypothetical protein